MFGANGENGLHKISNRIHLLPFLLLDVLKRKRRRVAFKIQIRPLPKCIASLFPRGDIEVFFNPSEMDRPDLI